MSKKEITPERIAKVIAASGYCSRRDAERLIEDGKVRINGELVTQPGTKVTDEVITINGVAIEEKQAPRLFLYYKPVGLVTTHRDEMDRPTVFENLPEGMPRVISVGRLDLNSEGLLLLTTDGETARQFELPSNKMERVYRVRVYGQVRINELKKLSQGIEIDGVRYASIKVEIEKLDTNSWLRITLLEGKNREIRRVMKYFDLEVSRLIRIQYGKFKLDALKPGEVKEVKF